MSSLQNILQLMLDQRSVQDLGKKWEFWLKSDKSEAERLRIGIESILVQNTNWGNVERVKINLHQYFQEKEINLNVWDLHWWINVDNEILKEIIKPGGFYNQKSVYLKELANNWSRVENASSMRERRKVLLSIKGIGHESGDSILLYAFDEPSFVIDAYTKRILLRTEQEESKKLSNSYIRWQKLLVENEPDNSSTREAYKWLHAYFIFIGSQFCLKKKPKCKNCKINSNCEYYTSNQ